MENEFVQIGAIRVKKQLCELASLWQILTETSSA